MKAPATRPCGGSAACARDSARSIPMRRPDQVDHHEGPQRAAVEKPMASTMARLRARPPPRKHIAPVGAREASQVVSARSACRPHSDKSSATSALVLALGGGMDGAKPRNDHRQAARRPACGNPDRRGPAGLPQRHGRACGAGRLGQSPSTDRQDRSAVKVMPLSDAAAR